MHLGVTYALLAAALFGASTPLAKLLIGQVSPRLWPGCYISAAAWDSGSGCWCAR
jgi:hypothetical protein